MMRSSGQRLRSSVNRLAASEAGARRPRATLSGTALLANWEAICRRVPHQRILPMVKAQAYGHGADWAARLIWRQEKSRSKGQRLAGFGVATLDEALSLRASIAGAPIVVFSGLLPWNSESGQVCERFGLTPVLSSVEDWRSFVRGGWARRVAFEIKFNTGMNRLGISCTELSQVKKDLQRLAKQGIYPSGVLSHLACAESPHAPLSRAQRELFRGIQGELSPLFGASVEFHLGNSAPLWQAEAWDLESLGQRVRPGLSLYGIAPRGLASQLPLTPVMELSAPVVAIQNVRAGESIGYGRRFIARKALRVAILGMGYADGLDRHWGDASSLAVVHFDRVTRGRSRWVGAISMDLSAVIAPAGVRVGDRAQVFGAQIDPWVQAEAAGTIPYEILTSLGARVQRIYV